MMNPLKGDGLVGSLDARYGERGLLFLCTFSNALSFKNQLQRRETCDAVVHIGNEL